MAKDEKKGYSLFSQPKSRPALTRGEDRVIAGVCSGIAERIDADAVLVRVTAVVLLVCTFGLVAVPYIAFAAFLPASNGEGKPLNVSPLDVCSDRYHRVVEAGAARVEALRNYGIHADAGHIPPMPPASSGFLALCLQCPRKAWWLAMGTKRASAHPVVLALVTLTTLFFVFVANYWVSRIPGVSFWGFWPVLLIVAGTTLLVCFADKAPLRLRLCGLVVCIELCIALLPFSLGICPASQLRATH